MGIRRGIAATLLALALGLAAAGCGGSGSDNGDVTLKVGSGSSPEQRILGQIYAQALEGAGYGVKKEIVDLEINRGFEGIKQGKISGYPGHMNELLHYLFLIYWGDLPADPQVGYEKAKTELEKEGLTAFPPTPYALNFAVGMLKQKAEKLDLETNSDLKGTAEKMSLKGPYDCHTRDDCLGGLELHYGVVFGEGFSGVDPALRYKVLEKEEADASMLNTTDGRLTAEKDKFVVLEEDKNAFPAGNMIWVTTPKVVEKAGPDYEETIVEAQKGLTLPVMQRLVAEVELDGEPAADVAAKYLETVEDDE